MAFPSPHGSSNERYTALANRADELLRRFGGIATETELITTLFGATAKGPLFARLLVDVLSKDPRFQRLPDGRWSLATLGISALPLDAVEFVVLDIETTGLKPWNSHVFDIAALRLAGGQVVETFATLVNPGRRLPGYLLALTGLTMEELAEAPPLADVAEGLREFLGNAVLVGHGFALDLACLRHDLSLLGLPPLPNRTLDTLALAGRLLPGRRKPTLDNLASLLGLPVVRRHRALADARLVAPLFTHLLDLARAEGARTLADLPATAQGEGGLLGRFALLDASPLAEVSEGPGVYVLRDAAGQPVYVGKSVNLRERLATYFSRPPEYVRRMEGLLEAVADFETVPLGSELEALLLEARLIREYKPLFNVARQTKAQPAYLRLSVQEEFPRLSACAAAADDGALYYGPFRNGTAVRAAQRDLEELVPLRACRRAVVPTGRRRSRRRAAPCNRLRRGACLGPCEELMVQPAYRRLVDELVAFLAGDRGPVVARLQRELAAAAAERNAPLVATLQKRLRKAHTFTLALAGSGPVETKGGVAVIQASVDEEACEVFVVARGRYGGQLRLYPADTSAEELAPRLRELASAAETGSADEGNIVLRWLGERGTAWAVSLPLVEEDWQPAAEQVLSLGAQLTGEM